jgi:hypothetical protein
MKDIVTPVEYNGEHFYDYGMSPCGTKFYSRKRGPWQEISIHYPCKETNPSAYARIGFSEDGKQHTLLVHKAVLETLGDYFPIPEGVSEEVWEQTHYSVKNAMRGIWQVNHKNRDVHDHHIDNLEYVTAKENQQHYQESLKKSIVKRKKAKTYDGPSLESFFGKTA